MILRCSSLPLNTEVSVEATYLSIAYEIITSRNIHLAG